MTFHFKLEVIRVKCISEQSMEWGKDEMRLFGVGVSRKGAPFTTGYRSLGSYGDGDVKTGSPFPMDLFETDLANDGLEVLFHVWLVEEDGGGIRDRASSIEETFREEFLAKVELLNSVGFPRDCIPFAAFDKALPAVQNRLEDASTKGRNDELYAPAPLLLRFPDVPVAVLPGQPLSTDVAILRSKRGGAYEVVFRHSYEAPPPVSDHA